MTTTQYVLIALLWSCLAAVFYTYAVYPLLIFALARLFGRKRPKVDPCEALPRLSLLVAAYNEETVIEGRIQNALAMDYPKEKLEIVVATDGCGDRTPEIVRRYSHRGVRLFEFPQRRGKATALNASLPELHGEIVMFSDANTYAEPDAARQLVRWFEDAKVGAVCGRLVLKSPENGRNVDSMYWKYETFIKRQEGKLGALLGANGGIYAIRKSHFVPIPNDTILDDLVIPLLAKLQKGCDVVFEPAAVAHEETPANVSAEFRRRSRIGAGGFGSLKLLGGLLNPRHGWVFFTFMSHKLLRWCCPFFLILLFTTNVLLAGDRFYFGTLIAQIGFYLTSVVVAYLPARVKLFRYLRLTTMFTSMNCALLVGFGRWLLGSQSAMWKRTARIAEGTVTMLPHAVGRSHLPAQAESAADVAEINSAPALASES